MLELRMSPLELMKYRLRTGMLSVGNVKIASQLGNSLARSIFPGESLINWEDEVQRHTLLMSIDRVTSVRLAITVAEKALLVYEAVYPDDGRPRAAIQKSKDWLINPVVYPDLDASIFCTNIMEDARNAAMARNAILSTYPLRAAALAASYTAYATFNAASGLYLLYITQDVNKTIKHSATALGHSNHEWHKEVLIGLLLE